MNILESSGVSGAIALAAILSSQARTPETLMAQITDTAEIKSGMRGAPRVYKMDARILAMAAADIFDKTCLSLSLANEKRFGEKGIHSLKVFTRRKMQSTFNTNELLYILNDNFFFSM